VTNHTRVNQTTTQNQTSENKLVRGLAYVLLVLFLFFGGCHSKAVQPVMRPKAHSIRSGQLLVLSDIKLPKDHPVIQDLVKLRKQVAITLDLPVQKEEVVVYIFSNQEEYQHYLDTTYPGLPRRRAYFVGTAKELAVYTYWGERIQEDLRHEYTHGLLHGSLRNVPLWIDEGLAEYFEVIGPSPGTVNSDYANRLTKSLSNGWRPNLKRLERIEEFSSMQHVDYQESWAWVHFMLHSSPETREALLSYLHDLRSKHNPSPLSERLENAIPSPKDRFIGYLTALPMKRLLSTRPHSRDSVFPASQKKAIPHSRVGTARISSGERARENR
jgi:hypothetical protein